MQTNTDTTGLAAKAYARIADAIERGKPAEARSWLKLTQELRKLEPEAASETSEETAPPVRPEAEVALVAERDRLQALVRSGRAKPRDHFALKAARQALAALDAAASPKNDCHPGLSGGGAESRNPVVSHSDGSRIAPQARPG